MARVEQACMSLGVKPAGMACKAMKGLVDEASEHLKGLKRSSCTDAELIHLAQKVEHYEIGSYGTLCEWARVMGHEEVVNLLQQNLNEEKETNDLLTEIAEDSINQMAAEDSKQMDMGKGDTKRRTKAATIRKAPSRGTGRATPKRTTARGATNGRAKATGRTTTAHGNKKTRGKASAR